MKRRVVRAFAKYVLNPFTKRYAGLLPGTALLETTGRRTGKRRHTPVGGKVIDGVFWLVAEHGRGADYVLNIEAHPKVRLRVGRKWRTGTAHTMPDDDPRQRLRKLPTFNSAVVRLLGTDHLSVRIDLDDP
jgi:deazaflavin-dependent oxidoreductase (nitroreductase family)